MTEPSLSPEPKKKRHFVRNLLIILFFLFIGVMLFLYYGIYDEGVRSGTVLRVSKKGVLFKTYEGQLNLQTFGAMKGVTPFMETFNFSISKKSPEVVQELEDVALSGERVNLRYVKRYVRFPWRGDTKYFIIEVERTGALQK
ncbi:MAG: hypothetical protein K0B08_00775 [Bacteroidales bacterium]|nr:hypothetical protein [Bacteroidales bacterium]